MSCGIYAIKNKINDKIYIGRSTDIHRRWVDHIRAAKKNDQCKIHLAMSELGIENFYLEIIEYCDISKLNEREEHYITIFDSIKNGYNNGHSSNFLDGENNPNAKITSKIVEEIRILQSKCELTRAQIYDKYKDLMSYANFLYICNYKTWVSIKQELNTEEILSWHKKHSGNELKKFNKDQLIDILQSRKQGCTYSEIANKYQCNRRTIERICTGCYYKKELNILREEYPDLFHPQGSTTIT